MGKATVFIVDDDASIRRALARLLGSAGFQVQAFADPREFLELDRVQGAECLILDVRMPQLGGIELHRRLEAAKRGLPTIFMTAYKSGDVDRLSSKKGVVAVLYKPFDADLLLQAIEKALRGVRGVGRRA